MQWALGLCSWLLPSLGPTVSPAPAFCCLCNLVLMSEILLHSPASPCQPKGHGSWALSSSSVLDTPLRGSHKGTLVLRKGVESPLLTQRDGGEGDGGRKGEGREGRRGGHRGQGRGRPSVPSLSVSSDACPKLHSPGGLPNPPRGMESGVDPHVTGGRGRQRGPQETTPRLLTCSQVSGEGRGSRGRGWISRR